MDWQFVTVERRGRVALVRFDRRDGLNALSRDLMRELTQVARSFEDDLETTALVLAGGGRGFSAGLDLKDPRNAELPRLPLDERRHHLALGPRMCRAWQEVPALTIAAIEGFCVGGAVSLAVACDWRVAARDAHFRVPEIALGMNMSWQTLPRLARLIGPARTKRLVVLAEPVSAEEALDWGLVDEVAAPGGAVEAALSLAGKVAAMPALPVRMTKEAVDAFSGALDHAASHMDADQFALAQTSEDFREGVAAYLEKRRPRFRGR